MIKYAHRGLVKNGTLPFQFYLFYLLVSVVFYCQWLLTAFSRFFGNDFDSHKAKKLMKIFSGGEWDKTVEIPKVRYFATLMFIFAILLLIMSLGIFYTKRKSENHYYYRHNVFNFNLTLFWGLLHCGLFISLFLTLNMGEIIIHSLLSYCMICSHIIKSIVTIFENQKNFPELFSNMKIRNLPFNIINPTKMEPRKEILMPSIPFKQNAR